MTHRGYRPFNTTEDEEEDEYMTLSERIARLSTSRVNYNAQPFSPTSSSWQPKSPTYNNLTDIPTAPEPFTYLRNNNSNSQSVAGRSRQNNTENKIIYAQVVVDNNLSNNNSDTFNNKYTVHRAYNNNSHANANSNANHNFSNSHRDHGGYSPNHNYKRSGGGGEVKRSNTNVTRVMINSSDEYDDYQPPPPRRVNEYRLSSSMDIVDPEPINYFDYNKKRTLRVNDFYQPEKYFYDDDDSIVKNHKSTRTKTATTTPGSFSEWRSSNQINHHSSSNLTGKYGKEESDYEKLEMPVNRSSKKNLFSTLNRFFSNKSKNSKKKEGTYQSYEKPYNTLPAVTVEPPTPQVNQLDKNYYGGHVPSAKEQEGINYKDEPVRPNKVKRRWTMREKDSNTTNNIRPSPRVDDGPKIGSQTLDRNYSNKNRTSFIGGYNTLDHNTQRKTQQYDQLNVPSSRGYYNKKRGGLASSAEDEMNSDNKYLSVGKSFTSSPLPSSRSSNKVYLHDQTVIDVIPKMNNTGHTHQGSSAGRRTVSKDDISIISRSTGQMHQSRQLSRSMSVMAPWGPTRNRKELDYTNYNNTLPSKANRSSNTLKRSKSPLLPGFRTGSSGNSSKVGSSTINKYQSKSHHQPNRPAVVSSSIESLIHNQNQQRNSNLSRSKSFQQGRNKNDTIKRENKFTSWLKRK